jgi:hypothetical protein
MVQLSVIIHGYVHLTNMTHTHLLEQLTLTLLMGGKLPPPHQTWLGYKTTPNSNPYGQLDIQYGDWKT